MAIPFTVVSGAVLIADTTGKTVDMIDSDGIRMKTEAKILGADGLQQMDVIDTSSGKRAKVETIFSPDGLIIPTLGNDLLYEDMNVANGGVARDTTIGNVWTTIYEKTSLDDGILMGFLVTVEQVTQDWRVRLLIDGKEVFGDATDGISLVDLQDQQIYGFDINPNNSVPEFLGFLIRNNTLRWEGPNDLPIRIDSAIGSIEILLRKAPGGGNKKFRAGLVTRAVI
jgi:hypothetical protein